jgi:hypothetical protein
VDPELGALADFASSRDRWLYRRLLAARRGPGEGFRPMDAASGAVAYERPTDVVAINTGDAPAAPPPLGEVVLATPGRARGGRLAPHAGVLAPQPQ